MARYLMTHSLLSSWLYMLESEFVSEGRNPMDEFMMTLRREQTPTTEAMQKGIDFENLVTDLVNGKMNRLCEVIDAEVQDCRVVSMPITDHPWYEPARQVADIVRGGILQYVAKKEATVNGVDLLLYGRLDALKCGSIYDVKFTGRYEAGNYFDSTQHPMYMYLVPEARDFTYLASNGTNVWKETYLRDETGDILTTVSQFLTWLHDNRLEEVYFNNWGAKK